MILLMILISFALAQSYSYAHASISREQFNAAVQSCGFPLPDPKIYPRFTEATKDFSQAELAEFIAQLNHESGGFQFLEEIACQNGNHCANNYWDGIGIQGKSYHGRGFIQLSWGANYAAASKALGLKDRLLRQPELVAKNVRLACFVSAWYWRDRVRPQLKRSTNQRLFGLSTRAINGAIECNGGPNERARNRYRCYLKVADALGLENKALEAGCYN